MTGEHPASWYQRPAMVALWIGLSVSGGLLAGLYLGRNWPSSRTMASSPAPTPTPASSLTHVYGTVSTANYTILRHRVNQEYPDQVPVAPVNILFIDNINMVKTRPGELRLGG